MKNILKLTLAVATLLAVAVPASAQKFGYVDSRELVFALPDIKEVETNIQKMGEDFMLKMEEMQVEGNKKLDAYQKEEATLSETIKRSRQEEISAIGQRIEELQAQARVQMASKEEELMEPLIEKVRVAIEAVMKAQGLAGVFEGQALASVDDTQMVNVTPLVKKQLGIAE